MIEDLKSRTARSESSWEWARKHFVPVDSHVIVQLADEQLQPNHRLLFN